MTSTTSGARSTAAQPKMRPVTTSQASESGGEPPGRWWGPGAKALGLEHGQLVEGKPYDLLFGERKAPDGIQLGRPAGSGQNAADIYARLLAAEPHATAERKHQLRIDATRQARQSPLYFDLTLSLSKSTSIFHASLGENARLAHREAGDAQGNAYWSGLVARHGQKRNRSQPGTLRPDGAGTCRAEGGCAGPSRKRAHGPAPT
jgi:TrwC relaxase